MSSSPFEIFRRNLKPLMVVLTILALFSFVVLPALDTYLRRGGAMNNDPVAAEFDGVKVHRSRVALTTQNHASIVRFLSELASETMARGGMPQTAGFQYDQQQGQIQSLGIDSNPSEQATVNTLRFYSEAKKAGFELDDTAVKNWLQRFTDGTMSDGEIVAMLMRSSGNQLGQQHLFEQLRMHLLADLYQRSSLAALTNGQLPVVTPLGMWQNFLKLNQNATVDAYGVLVSEYIDQTDANPSESEVKRVYDEGKDLLKYPNDTSPTPKFKRPDSAKLEYLIADLNKFVEAEKAKISEEQLRAEYERRLAGGDFQLPASAVQDAADQLEAATSKPEDQPQTDAAKASESSQEKGAAESEEPAKSDEPAKEESSSRELGQSAVRLVAFQEGSGESDTPKTETPPETAKEVAKEAADAKPTEADKPAEDAKAAEKKSEPPMKEDSPETAAEETKPAEKPADEKPAESKDAKQNESEKKPAEKEPSQESAEKKDTETKGGDQKDGEKNDASEKMDAEKKDAEDKGADKKAEGKENEAKADTEPSDKPQDQPEADSKAAEMKPEDAKSDGKDAEPKPTAEDKEKETAPAKDDAQPAAKQPPTKQPAAKQEMGDGLDLEDEPEPTKPQSFEEVRDQIATDLATEPARRAFDQAVSRAFQQMQRYFTERSVHESNVAAGVQTEADAPARLDLKAVAKEYGLDYGETDGLINRVSIEDTEPGQSYGLGSGFNRRGPPLSAMLFGAQMQDGSMLPSREEFAPLRSVDLETQRTFVTWKTEDIEAYTPSLEEARDEVIEAIRLAEARGLAKAAAEKLAAQASAGDKKLAEIIPAGKEANLTEGAGPFTWLDQVGFMQTSIGNVPELNAVGDEFMRAVFTSEVGQAAVAGNDPQTVYYVVRPTEFQPDTEALREQFRQPQQRFMAQLLGNEDARDIIRGFYQSVDERTGFDMKLAIDQ